MSSSHLSRYCWFIHAVVVNLPACLSSRKTCRLECSLATRLRSVPCQSSSSSASSSSESQSNAVPITSRRLCLSACRAVPCRAITCLACLPALACLAVFTSSLRLVCSAVRRSSLSYACLRNRHPSRKLCGSKSLLLSTVVPACSLSLPACMCLQSIDRYPSPVSRC